MRYGATLDMIGATRHPRREQGRHKIMTGKTYEVSWQVVLSYTATLDESELFELFGTDADEVAEDIGADWTVDDLANLDDAEVYNTLSEHEIDANYDGKTCQRSDLTIDRKPVSM